MRRRFQQVDVFADEAFLGNPVAVVLDAEGLDTEAMQRIASWTNLSETTFVSAPSDPGADYAVRIFTPDVEVPFAGHPTLGTCHAWIADGGASREDETVVQQCAAGLVRVRRDGARLAFAAPPLVRSGPLDEATLTTLTSVLGIAPGDVVDAAWADNGPGWAAVLLADADAVLALRPDLGDARNVYVGVAGPHPVGAPSAFEVRTFFREDGPTTEDPVTGSFNASLAQWLLASGRATAPYVASQGTALGRRGRVHVDQDADGTVWVGGDTTTLVTGHLDA